MAGQPTTWTGPDGYTYSQQQDGTTYVTVNNAQYQIGANGLLTGDMNDPNVALYNNSKTQAASPTASTYGTGGGGTATTPTTTPSTTSPTTTPTTPTGGATSTASGVNVAQYMANQVANPTLAAGAELTPTLQSVQNGELLNGSTSTLNPTGANAAQTPSVTAPVINQTEGQASTTNASDATAPLNPNGNTYNASTGNNAAQGTAAQGQVNPLDTVQGQLNSLYAQMVDGTIPTWAKGSVNAAQEYLAARNMAPSSIGAAAIFGAIQNSALNIASQDASTYFQMDVQNLGNQQQMALQNLQNRQQGLLSDQAATNAAAQFNATNQQQMQQFISSMIANINNQNADRTQAMSTFNAQQANSINSANAQYQYQAQTFNAQQIATINQFNSSLQNQREQFNAQNAFAVEQSNVLWRRSINTANTAAVNAANQTNVQNQFNISQTALNNIWQQFRDESSWIFTASENEKNRQFNTAMAANNRTFVSDNQSNTFAQAAGAFAGSLLLG